MEEKLGKLFEELDKNLESYCSDIVNFTLYRETGCWEGEKKPTGKYMDEKMKEYFEKPLVEFINNNHLK